MKITVTLLALVALAYSAPQPRKLFHEHYEDFIDIIMEEAGKDLQELAAEYVQFEEFRVSLNYMQTSEFKNLVYEMEDLPEFKAVVQFLEGHNIDIIFFVNVINDLVDGIQRRSTRSVASGNDMSSFVKDCISKFPKEKLVALFEEKKAEDESFKVAMESFELEEWNQIYSALWENEIFKQEVDILLGYGIDVAVLLDEAVAIMGIFK
ncbi:uncharacterized protein LOC116773029 [Danaus plexippus]|uniref:uncharacterized protein LOC116773029 n=1 Tax=Danaus plexippus TaxID=13037 RepID=UPI0013C3EEE3|nr:uncharacterized protein LOC116773029 [Danaus plexippus]